MMVFKSLRMTSPICIIFTAIAVSALVTLCAEAQSEVAPHERQKRDALFGLCYFIERYSRRSCLSYLDYGCWCGPGGRGRPVDRIDDCCRTHNNCYARASRSCGRMNPGNAFYLRWCSSSSCSCSSWNTSCGSKVCSCDLDFARCIRGKSYNSYYWNYNARNRC